MQVLKIFLKVIVIPFLIFGIACWLSIVLARQYPGYAAAAFAMLLMVLFLRARRKRKLELERGWRVGHEGRDDLYYAEFREGRWRQIYISGEMLVGKPRHVIYWQSTSFPEWAQTRREEIIGRIKTAFPPPDYRYEGVVPSGSGNESW